MRTTEKKKNTKRKAKLTAQREKFTVTETRESTRVAENGPEVQAVDAPK